MGKGGGGGMRGGRGKDERRRHRGQGREENRRGGGRVERVRVGYGIHVTHLDCHIVLHVHTRTCTCAQKNISKPFLMYVLQDPHWDA